MQLYQGLCDCVKQASSCLCCPQRETAQNKYDFQWHTASQFYSFLFVYECLKIGMDQPKMLINGVAITCDREKSRANFRTYSHLKHKHRRWRSEAE